CLPLRLPSPKLNQMLCSSRFASLESASVYGLTPKSARGCRPSQLPRKSPLTSLLSFIQIFNLPLHPAKKFSWPRGEILPCSNLRLKKPNCEKECFTFFTSKRSRSPFLVFAKLRNRKN